jgi:hypothetical protein
LGEPVNWSWLPVPRGQLEAVEAERDHWKQVAETYMDHQRRLERKDAGLTELAPDRKPVDEMPTSLRRILRGYRSSTTRRMKFREAYELRARGESWVDIQREFVAEIDPEAVQAE